MLPTIWPRRILLAAALAIAAVLLAAPALHLGKRAAWHATALPAATAPAAPVRVQPIPERVCVTPAGFCPIGLVRAGDPCSCPDPLHGNVAGHVETVGGPLTRTESRDWPGGDGVDGLYGP
jgi:hypothetical protein